MKLSQMSTDQACDCMIALAEPVANIAEDEKVTAALRGMSETWGKLTNLEAALMVLKKILPLALKEHRTDVFQILSALTGKGAEEIAAQPIGQTIADARGIVDKDLVDFFTSSAATAANVSSAPLLQPLGR